MDTRTRTLIFLDPFWCIFRSRHQAGLPILFKCTSTSLFTGGTFYYNLDNFHWYLNSYTSFFKIRRYYSETCLNQTLSKQKTCLNWTLSKQKTCLNQTDFTVPSTKCLCNLNLCKPNTCLNWTNSLVPKGFGLDRFHCSTKDYFRWVKYPVPPLIERLGSNPT